MSIIGAIYGNWRSIGITGCHSGPLTLRKVGAKNWELAEPCLYRVEWKRGPLCLVIPSGYRCDGASIPRRFRDVVDPEWAIDWSILHDLLYETQGGSRQYRVWQIDGTYRLADLVDWRTNERISISRAEADAILRAGWELGSGMPADMADCGYAAVRTFGRDAWLSEEPSTVANTMASAEEWCTSAVA